MKKGKSLRLAISLGVALAWDSWKASRSSLACLNTVSLARKLLDSFHRYTLDYAQLTTHLHTASPSVDSRIKSSAKSGSRVSFQQHPSEDVTWGGRKQEAINKDKGGGKRFVSYAYVPTAATVKSDEKLNLVSDDCICYYKCL